MTQTDDKSKSDDRQKAGSEDSASGNAGLDDLLEEFEAGSKKPEKKATKKKEEPDEVRDFVRQMMAERQRKQVNSDINSAVERLSKSEVFKGVPKPLARRMLISYAYDNPSFDQAFQQRGENPSGWESAITDAERALSEEVKDLPRSDSRDDVEAAKATVEGADSGDSASSDEPKVADLMNMSDAEFKRYKDALDAA